MAQHSGPPLPSGEPGPDVPLPGVPGAEAGLSTTTARDATASADGTTGASLLRGGAWLSVALVLPQLFTLVVSVAAARFLGPSDMGRQSYISFVAVTASTLAALGLPVAVQRFVATAAGQRRPGQVSALAVLAWRASALGGLLALMAVVAVGSTTYPDLRAAWVLAGVVAGMTVVQSTASNVLFGLQQFRQATTIGLVMGVVGVGAALGALSLGYGIVGMFAAEALVMTVTMSGTVLLSARAVRPHLREREPLGELRGELLRFAAVIGAGLAIEVVVFKRSEFLFLERYSSDQQIAFYSVAFAAVAAAGRLPTAVVQLVLPAVSTLAGAEQHDRIASGFARGMRLMLTVTLPLAAGSIALGPLALRAVYGREYAAAGVVLAILAPVPLLLGPLTAVCSATLTALGVLRSPLLWGVVALFVTLALDLTLIPRLDSVGAALANNGGQIAGSVPIIVLAQRRLQVSWARPGLIRPLLASTVAAVAAWAASAAVEPATGGLVALAVGAAVGSLGFLGLAAVVKVLDHDDGSWLADALGRRAATVGDVVRRLSRAPA